MNRVVVFLAFASVFSGTLAFSFTGVEHSDGLIRVPLTPRHRRAADGTKVEMINYKDFRYGFPIDVGTPAQTLNVMLDTGSEDLWFAWKKADKSDPKCAQICDAVNFFDDDKSTSITKTEKEFSEDYVGGGTKGKTAYDTVSIGGLKATNQPFSMIYQGAKPEGFDGLMGMSYNAASLTDKSTTLERLKDQGQIKKAIACVKLAQEKVGKSEIIFGGCDVDAVYAPVMKINGKYTGWRLNMTKLVMRSGDKEVLTLEPNHETVLDSGSGARLGVPTKILKKITETLGPESTWKGTNHNTISCDIYDKLPNLEFSFGDATVTVTPDSYAWKYFSECQIGLYDMGEGNDFLFGTLLFHSAGTIIFDKDQNRIGFEKK